MEYARGDKTMYCGMVEILVGEIFLVNRIFPGRVAR